MKRPVLVTSEEAHREAKRKAVEAGVYLQRFIELAIRLVRPDEVRREHLKRERKAG